MALRLTMAQAARRLGVSHDAVRFVLKGRPARGGEEREVGGGAAVRRARAALPRDRFARFYLDEYRSLKWIAEHAGVNVDAIKALVREYGMTREVERPAGVRSISTGSAPNEPLDAPAASRSKRPASRSR